MTHEAGVDVPEAFHMTPYRTTSKALHVQFRRAVTKRTDVLERNAAGTSAGSLYEIFCEPVLVLLQSGKGTALPMLYDLTRLGSIFPPLVSHWKLALSLF